MVLGRLAHYAADVVLVSAVLAGVKHSSGFQSVLLLAVGPGDSSGLVSSGGSVVDPVPTRAGELHGGPGASQLLPDAGCEAPAVHHFSSTFLPAHQPNPQSTPASTESQPPASPTGPRARPPTRSSASARRSLTTPPRSATRASTLSGCPVASRGSSSRACARLGA